MDKPIHPKAAQMINEALKPIIKRGRSIDRLQLYVSRESKLAEYATVQTTFGELRIKPGEYVPKGYSYIMEDSGMQGRGFAWVSKPAGEIASSQ
ncbi:MAG: hypothetical protein K0R28_2689 [Paenibacillus sp.]|jgi:hypothetical protein|nr:hypothetical protein [Paenibacillus sp.]